MNRRSGGPERTDGRPASASTRPADSKGNRSTFVGVGKEFFSRLAEFSDAWLTNSLLPAEL